MKKEIDLWLFTGKKNLNRYLHVNRPAPPNRKLFRQLSADMIQRRWFSNDGPLVQELERRLAQYLEVKHCVAVCNGSMGLLLASKALELDGQVIVPAFTFVALPQALSWNNIQPIFCDIDAKNHCLNPDQVEALITPDTTGIIGVHLWGNCCDVAALEQIAARHRLKLLYDASHAFGSRCQGKALAGFGACVVYSLHATKCFHTGEGGIIATNDSKLAERLKIMRNFGFDGLDSVVSLGLNGKMSELSAIMGLSILTELDQIIARQRANKIRYRHALGDIAGLKMNHRQVDCESNDQYIVVEITGKFPLSRDELMLLLHTENILARRYFWPGCHRLPPYANSNPAQPTLPTTDIVSAQVLVLPNGSDISAKEIDFLSQVIQTGSRYAEEIKIKLAAMKQDWQVSWLNSMEKEKN